MKPGKPVKSELGLFGDVKLPPTPATIDHVPVPTLGVLPASVAVEPTTVCSGQAFDGVGGWFTVIVAVSPVVIAVLLASTLPAANV